MSATLLTADRSTSAPVFAAALNVRLGAGGEPSGFRLREGKNTIGSSPRCDLQLQVPGLRPLHCLVSVEGDAVRVNRWAPGLRLNGQEFVESALEWGDQLTVGAVTFELVPASEAAPRRPLSKPPAAPPQPQRVVPSAPQASAPSSPRLVAEPAAEPPIAPAAPEPKRTPDQARSQAFSDALLVRTWTRMTKRGAAAQRLAAELRSTRQQLASLAERILQQESRLDAALGERAAAVAERDDLAKLLGETNRLLADESAARESAAGEVERLRNAADQATAAAEKRLAQLQTELDAQRLPEGVSQELRASLASAEERARASEEQTERLADELAASRQAYAVAEEKIAAAAASLTELEQRLAAADAETTRLSAELEAERAAAKPVELEPTEDHALQVGALQTELDGANANNDRLTADLVALREEFVALQAELAATVSARAEATTKLDTVLQERDELAAAHDETHRRVIAVEAREEELEATVRDLRDRLQELSEESAGVEEGRRSSLDSAVDPSPATDQAEHDDEAAEAIERLRAASLWRDHAQDQSESGPDDPRDAVSAPVAANSAPAESASEPSSFYERYRHLLDEDETQNSAGIQPTSPPPAASQPNIESSLGETSDDDEALQAYMENMMRRMRGESPAEVAERSRAEAAALLEPRFTEPAPADHETAQATPPSPAPSTDAPAPPVDPIDLETLKQSTAKPALPTDINALRELANNSARNAIAKHRKDRLNEAVLGKLIISGLALGAAAYLFLTCETLDSMQFLAACEIGVLGGWAMWRLFMNLLAAAADQVRPAQRGKSPTRAKSAAAANEREAAADSA